LFDGLVELKRLGQRPAMLEGVEAAGSQRRSLGEIRRRTTLEPRQVAAPIEGRDHCLEHFRAGVVDPDDPGPARTEEPLVATGCEHVAAKARKRIRLVPESVNAVDEEQDALRAPLV